MRSLRQEGWWEIAEAYETKRHEHTQRQREITESGLCRTCKIVFGQYSLVAGLNSIPGSCRYFGFWLGFSTQSDVARATFAYLMYNMTDEERDEIKDGL